MMISSKNILSADRKNIKGRSRSSLSRSEATWGFIFLIPAIAFLIVFMMYPILNVFRYSLTSWDGMGNIKFIGLDNYKSIFTSADFWTVIKNNMYFLLIGVPIWTLFPLIVAVLLYEEIPGWRFFRSAFFFPAVLSTVIVGILFRSFFDYNGPINTILRDMGLSKIAIEWLAAGSTSLPIIILAINWAGFGSATLIYLAGMSSITPSIYESSMLDGANWWQRFIYITIPMILKVIEFNVVLNIVYAFTSLFNYVFVMTSGGPGYESTVIEFLIYIKAFRSNQLGYACALAVILFFIVFAFSRLSISLFSKGEDWSE